MTYTEPVKNNLFDKQLSKIYFYRTEEILIKWSHWKTDDITLNLMSEFCHIL